MIITNEISLATALNNRIDNSKIGPFALTPRQISRLSSIELTGKQIAEDAEIISIIANNANFVSSKLDGRYIFGEIQNYRTIARFVPNPMEYIYTESSKKVCETYRSIDNTLESVMLNPKLKTCNLYTSNKVIGVIGKDLFNYIDTQTLPESFIEIDPFIEGENADIENHTLYRIGNDMQIAKHIASIIDKNDAGSYAVVLNPESNLLQALKTQFDLNGIKYIDEPPITDLFSVRDYLNMLEQSLRYPSLEYGDMKQILSIFGLGCYMSSGMTFNNYAPFRDEERRKVDVIKKFMSSIYRGETTFEEALIYKKGSKPYNTIVAILDKLGMNDRIITNDSIREIRYLATNLTDIESDELEEKTSNWGVLLIDCRNSVYVDRNNIIFTGMEQDWDIKLTGKKYIADKELEHRKCADRLTILLQQGDQNSRLYLTHRTVSGQEPKPALTFFEICNKKIESFRDIFAKEENGWLANGGANE